MSTTFYLYCGQCNEALNLDSEKHSHVQVDSADLAQFLRKHHRHPLVYQDMNEMPDDWGPFKKPVNARWSYGTLYPDSPEDVPSHPPACRRCNVSMELGHAIFPAVGINAEGEAQQGFHTAPPPLVNVWKCPKCGHSIDAPKAKQ